MMAININATFAGLTTLTLGCPTTDFYTIQGTLELPSVVQGSTANSSVVVTVTHNGTIYTGSAGARGFSNVGFSATAGDTVSIALTSAAAVDQQPGAVKCSVQMWEGAN